MGSKCAKAVMYGLATAVILAIGAAYSLAHLRHLPDEPLQISRTFVDLVQAGDLDAAYRMTDRGTSVGSTLVAFDANIRRQLRIDAFPTHRSVTLLGARGGDQSYGNRLRRWIMGRKIDPDQVSVDYVVGPPFEVRLRSDDLGGWRITFFQSHAM